MAGGGVVAPGPGCAGAGDPARGEGMTQAGAGRTAARPSPARAAGGMETNVSAETSDS